MNSEKTRNCILRISDENTLKLVQLYEQEECLWNTHLEDYRNRVKRAEAAQRIARELNIKHFEAKHVMVKFKNLRNSYCQELKKVAQSLNSSDGATDVYKPRVFWFSAMDSFIRPHLHAPRSAVARSESTSQDGFIKKEPGLEDVEEWVQMTQTEASGSIQNMEDSSSDSDDRPLESRASKRSPLSSPHILSKRPRSEADFEQKLVYTSLKDISSQMHLLLSRNNDHFERFGSYIASLLRVLPPQKALMLQPKIVSLIAMSIGEVNEGRVSQSDSANDTK